MVPNSYLCEDHLLKELFMQVAGFDILLLISMLPDLTYNIISREQ